MLHQVKKRKRRDRREERGGGGEWDIYGCERGKNNAEYKRANLC
jgi:hypothetical protein